MKLERALQNKNCGEDKNQNDHKVLPHIHKVRIVFFKCVFQSHGTKIRKGKSARRIWI